MNIPPLTLDNIQFRFDENGLLHIRFVNLKPTITGQFIILKVFGLSPQITAILDNFNWELVFIISKKNSGNGKLDIEFKYTEESEINFDVILCNSEGDKIGNNEMGQRVRNGIKKLDYSALKTQLRSIAQLILETLQSNLK